MILFAAQESSALPTLAETQAVAAEVHEDLQQLKPNSILESIKAWAPGFYPWLTDWLLLPLSSLLAHGLPSTSAIF